MFTFVQGRNNTKRGELLSVAVYWGTNCVYLHQKESNWGMNCIKGKKRNCPDLMTREDQHVAVCPGVGQKHSIKEYHPNWFIKGTCSFF